jgi:O-antigen ligase
MTTSGISRSGARAAPHRSLPARESLLFACLVIPWVNPFSDGPSTWFGPWLVGFVCGVVAYGFERPASPANAVTGALASIAGWALLRSGFAPETVALAAGCLLVWMTTALACVHAQRADWGRLAALTWIAAAALSTFAGLCQYFGLADHLAPWINATSAGEAFANLRQRNQFASLTVIGTAALLFWWPTDFRRRYAIAAIAWLALGNAVTTSRTGLLQLILLGVLAYIWPGQRQPRARLWATGMLSYIAASVALPWILSVTTGVEANHLWSRIATSDACGSRLVLWSNVIHLIAQKPWLGWGWGELDFAHFMTLYTGPRFCDILDNAHNLPLHVAVELGLPAAVLICAGLLWVLVRARPWRESDPVRQLAWAALSVIAIHSLLEYPLWYGPFQIALGLCLGLLCSSREENAAKASAVAKGAHVARLALAVLLLVASAYTAWDYHRVSQIYLPVASRSPEWREDPLSRMRDSWLFRNQVQFAELTITPLSQENAAWTHDSAQALLHFSPEPRVIEKLIDSSVMLGRTDEALMQLARFRAAFPDAYAAWRQEARIAP